MVNRQRWTAIGRVIGILIVPVLVKVAWQVGRFAARHEPPSRTELTSDKGAKPHSA